MGGIFVCLRMCKIESINNFNFYKYKRKVKEMSDFPMIINKNKSLFNINYQNLFSIYQVKYLKIVRNQSNHRVKENNKEKNKRKNSHKLQAMLYRAVDSKNYLVR